MSFIINEENTISFNNTPESEKELWNTNGVLNPRILIATPMYGGMCVGQYAAALMLTPTILGNHGMGTYYSYMTNESLITRARNRCVHEFLQTDATHLMFIDADIGWEPWHLLVMLDAQKDVIGGLYPMKSLPVKWCVNGIPGQVEDPNSSLIEVSKTGTGFLLMKREVFEKLDAHPAVRAFANDIGLPRELDPYMKTYFDTAVREGRYYSEDWTFCENWRDLGGQVWVDKRVLLRHTGTYTFDGNTQEQVFRDLKAVFEPQPVSVVATDSGAVPLISQGGHAIPDSVLQAEPVAEVVASSKKKPKKVANAK